jgi:hypothetical protein
VDYFVLRTCERLGMSEQEFLGLAYEGQVRLLAFNGVRMVEDASQ